MFITQLITVAIVHLFAVMSLGPDFAMVTRNSLIYSRKIAIYTSLGIAIGISVHVAYSILGIGLIISKSIFLFNIIKYVGAAYLIYIGYKSLKAKAPKEIKDEMIGYVKKDISVASAIWTGFLTKISRFQHYIERATGVVLIALGIKVALASNK
jgi:threonine/homoserine/homoserine lactone efflux protein